MRNQIRIKKNIRRKRRRRLLLSISLLVTVTAAALISKLPNINLADLSSTNAILYNLKSGTIVAEKNSDEKIFPASLTKIMTALVAIEHTADLNQRFQLPADIFPELYAQNASMAGFLPGEEVSLKDLLYGILLPSGAEAAIAYANYIADSEDDFAALMNQKAAELNMHNTHFCNSTGLHDINHYSSVKDMAILLQYALNNQDFFDAFTSSSYGTSSSNEHPGGFTMHSTLFSKLKNTHINNGNILGGKTGYTDEAKLCLASLALIDGEQYILITARADGSQQTEPFHIQDAVNVYSQIQIR